VVTVVACDSRSRGSTSDCHILASSGELAVYSQWGETVWTVNSCNIHHVTVLGSGQTVYSLLWCIDKWGLASTGKAKVGMVHSFVDKRVGVQAKLCDPLTTRAVPERFWYEVYLIKRRYIKCSLSTVTFTSINGPEMAQQSGEYVYPLTSTCALVCVIHCARLVINR